MTLVKITKTGAGGVTKVYELPPPLKYNLTFHKVYSDNSGMNDSGVRQEEVLRTHIPKLELEWELLTPTEFFNIMAAINGVDPLNVEYFYGTQADTYASAQMRVSNPPALSLQVPDDGDEQRWAIALTLEGF